MRIQVTNGDTFITFDKVVKIYETNKYFKFLQPDGFTRKFKKAIWRYEKMEEN